MTDKDTKNMNDVQMSDNNDQPKQTGEVSAQTINLRLPTFWEHNPETWFITAEVQFAVNKITKDDTKFGQIILALTSETCDSVLDLLKNPPSTGKYEALKMALIELNSPSQDKRLETLLDKQDIGDRRPSGVLRQIRTLAGTSFTAEIIKSLWLRKLPEYIRIALVPMQDISTSDELARMADKLHEALSSTQNVSSIQQQSSSTKRDQNQRPSKDQRYHTSQSGLEERMVIVEELLATLTNRSRSRSQGRRFPSRFQYRSISRPRPVKSKFICWYHRKYGTMAQKCAKPCQFKKPDTAMAMAVDQPFPNK